MGIRRWASAFCRRRASVFCEQCEQAADARLLCVVRNECVAVCCSVLQCVAVCCSVLQCVAVCCSVLQYVAMCCNGCEESETSKRQMHVFCERMQTTEANDRSTAHSASKRQMHKCVCVSVPLSLSPSLISHSASKQQMRGGGLGSRPKKMYGERLGDGVEYHLMSPTPRRQVPFTTGRRAH